MTKKLEEVRFKLPDELNMDAFVTLCELFEQYEDLEGLFLMYASDGFTLILDKVIYIMIKHRIVRPEFNFSESDFNDLNSNVND